VLETPIPASSEFDRQRYAAVGRALADPKRLCVLETLAAGELSVSDLSTTVGCQVPNMSQHLAVLRSAGLVQSRREGSTIYYRLADVRVLEAYRLIQSLARQGERPVVVDFWAAWCGPCRMVAPELEKLAEKYDGAVDVVKVDVDANPALSQAFNILSIPTIAFFQPGKQPMGVQGFKPLEQLEVQFGLSEYAIDPPEPAVSTESVASPEN